MKITFDDKEDKLVISLSKANLGKLQFFDKHWNGKGPVHPGIVWRKGTVEIVVELQGDVEGEASNV